MSEIGKKPTDDPNNRYSSPKNLGTWSSSYDADEFLYKFNHYNNYYNDGIMLSLGDYVTIKDGMYNKVWVIAGFDMEHNQTAADGTVYDNGYGICMIPKRYVVDYIEWDTNNTIVGGYMGSTVHKNTLPTIVDNLRNVLESHMVNRNVLLSSGIQYTSKYSSTYTWTTSYATLMSIGQLTGTFASHRNKYDDGEANYRLPLFNHENYWLSNVNFWTRNVWGDDTAYNSHCAWIVGRNGNLRNASVATGSMLRPLIYLR